MERYKVGFLSYMNQAFKALSTLGDWALGIKAPNWWQSGILSWKVFTLTGANRMKFALKIYESGAKTNLESQVAWHLASDGLCHPRSLEVSTDLLLCLESVTNVTMSLEFEQVFFDYTVIMISNRLNAYLYEMITILRTFIMFVLFMPSVNLD